LKKGKMFILTLLVMMILFSFTSCGKKTPLFFKDRAELSRSNGFSVKIYRIIHDLKSQI